MKTKKVSNIKKALAFTKLKLEKSINKNHKSIWFGGKHLKNIFDDGELDEKSVSSIMEHAATDNKTYQTKYYNLDAIISIGYRVNSKKATQFRQWATRVLKEFANHYYSKLKKI